MVRRLLRGRPSPWFLAAALLAAAAWFGTVRAAAGGERVQVVVAAHALAVGVDPAESSALSVVQIPAAALLPGMLQSADQLAGRTTVAPVAAGEPLTDASLGGRPGTIPSPLAPGERAVSLPAAAAGAALPILVPGARIDIVASIGETGDARTIVRGAEVITVRMAPDASGSADVGAILVRVRESDALRLSGALDHAVGVRVLPRPYREDVAP